MYRQHAGPRQLPGGDGGGPVLPPVLIGSRSLWVGADRPQAEELVWVAGAGYGDKWCQRIVSEPIAYNGSGTVNLTLTYFNDSEECYDGTRIYLRTASGSDLLLNQYTGVCTSNPVWGSDGGFTGRIGINTAVPAGTPWLIAPVTWTSRDFTAVEIPGGAQNITFVIEFTSDAAVSDEDGQGDFIWGPFACDNVTVGGTGVAPRTYTFEMGLEGWTPGVCPSVGDFTDVVYLDPLVYPIQDPCVCHLENNVLEMAADTGDGLFVHPVGQSVRLSSPICDLAGVPGMPAARQVFIDCDVYMEMPWEDGVAILIGWQYYPFFFEATQTMNWSPIDYGIITTGPPNPVCTNFRASTSIPNSAEQVIAIVEVLANCDALGIENCSGNSNFTPLVDNLVVGVTGDLTAPWLALAVARFQDVGSFPSSVFDVRAPGPANTWRNNNSGTSDSPVINGDSLVIEGPAPTTDPNSYWEAKMYWRVAKRGAFQADTEAGVDTAYKTWKTRVADGLAIDRPYRPEFTFGIMDSVQIGVIPQKNKFLSRFSEKDDDFLGESKSSDILPDDIFRPGTRIEYFFVSNYLKSPNDRYYLPDTAGASYYEFEILPGVRTANVANCGGTGLNYCAYHPATLLITGTSGRRSYVENALRSVLNGYPACTDPTGCVIPYDRNWDRYDYTGAGWNTNSSFARGSITGSNNGMTLNQILGYRSILVYGVVTPWDTYLYDQWLVSPDCAANANRQFLALSGLGMGGFVVPSFLNNTLAATLLCDAFNATTGDANCYPVEDAYCVRLQQVGVSAPYFPTLIDVDAYGNWCPQKWGYNVFTPDPAKGGVGNRIYQAEEGGKAMEYEQVIRYNSSPSANYKTVIDGVPWGAMTKRNPAGSGSQLCPTTMGDIMEGTIAEISAAMRWGFDVADNANIPKLANVKDLATCQFTWSSLPTEATDDAALRVNRLFQNVPNPFNPRTTIRFSLAQSGPVEILIYDVNGRQVKKLVDRPMDPGSYNVVWDGTNDLNHRVGSGVYWSQMKAGSYLSNKKMVVLK